MNDAFITNALQHNRYLTLICSSEYFFVSGVRN